MKMQISGSRRITAGGSPVPDEKQGGMSEAFRLRGRGFHRGLAAKLFLHPAQTESFNPTHRGGRTQPASVLLDESG